MVGQKETLEAERRRWHLGKEIPVAVILVLGLQTVGVVWWAATIAARVEYNREMAISAQTQQAVVDRRQDEDAQRSEARIVAQLEKLNVKMDRLIEGRIR